MTTPFHYSLLDDVPETETVLFDSGRLGNVADFAARYEHDFDVELTDAEARILFGEECDLAMYDALERFEESVGAANYYVGRITDSTHHLVHRYAWHSPDGPACESLADFVGEELGLQGISETERVQIRLDGRDGKLEVLWDDGFEVLEVKPSVYSRCGEKVLDRSLAKIPRIWRNASGFRDPAEKPEAPTSEVQRRTHEAARKAKAVSASKTPSAPTTPRR